MEKNRKIIDTSGALILAASSVVGGKEFEGPLGALFDFHDPSDRFGQKTLEKSEGEMQRLVLANVMSKLGVSFADIDALFAGDLMNQCVSSAYGLLEYDIPSFGLGYHLRRLGGVFHAGYLGVRKIGGKIGGALAYRLLV